MSRLTIILSAVAVVALVTLAIYRQLVVLRKSYKGLFQKVDGPLRTRYDLIPKLVETVKAFVQSEDDTLQAISEARNAASAMREKVSKDPTDSQMMKRLVGAENALTDHLYSLSLVIEKNAELKSNAVLQKLMNESSLAEAEATQARVEFNNAVSKFNSTREKFPHSVVSMLFEMQEACLFNISPPKSRDD